MEAATLRERGKRGIVWRWGGTRRGGEGDEEVGRDVCEGPGVGRSGGRVANGGRDEPPSSREEIAPSLSSQLTQAIDPCYSR